MKHSKIHASKSDEIQFTYQKFKQPSLIKFNSNIRNLKQPIVMKLKYYSQIQAAKTDEIQLKYSKTK